MSYLNILKEELGKSGLEITPEIATQLGSFSVNKAEVSAPTVEGENNEAVRAIVAKLEDPQFETNLGKAYKVLMLEDLKQQGIELNPEIIARLKAELAKNPHNFAGMFVSIL